MHFIVTLNVECRGVGGWGSLLKESLLLFVFNVVGPIHGVPIHFVAASVIAYQKYFQQRSC